MGAFGLEPSYLGRLDARTCAPEVGPRLPFMSSHLLLRNRDRPLPLHQVAVPRGRSATPQEACGLHSPTLFGTVSATAP